MEHSPHNVLVGPGATDYANRNGFVLEMNDALLVPETKRAYEVCLFLYTLRPSLVYFLSKLCLCR